MNIFYLKQLAVLAAVLFFFSCPSALASEWVARFAIDRPNLSSAPVNSLLQEVDGVSEVELSTAGVTVTYDSDDTDTEALQKKLTDAGFLVKKTIILKQGCD